jgi:carboxyl-terminal processing protease
LSFRINEKEKTKLEIIQEIMENEWYYGIDDDNISSTLELKMILSMQDLSKDPHTKYLTSLGSLSDSYTGLGVTINKYGEYYIVSEVSSTSSVEAGIKKGDILVSVNGISVKNKTLKEVEELTAQRVDVALGIVRYGNEINSANTITINARNTTYNPITVFTREYNDNVAYIQITEFNLDTAQNIRNYFSSLDSKYDDLVIDLRGNPGGYISAVREVLDIFVRSNKVVMYTVDKHGSVTTVKTNDDMDYIFDDIYILIDDDSASGSEALAAAMNYHLPNVVLVGETTYGKGSAQKTYSFEDGTYFHYTYALWKTPANAEINHIGVAPEIYDVNAGISSITLYDGNFKLYDYGEGVKSIQLFLSKLGYYSGEIHSFFDEETKSALMLFQKENGIDETGVFDNLTKGLFAKFSYDDEQTFKNEQLNRVLALMD